MFGSSWALEALAFERVKRVGRSKKPKTTAIADDNARLNGGAP